MAITFDQLKRLVEGEGFKYFVDPGKPVIMTGASGTNGRYQFLILLEVNGEFLQFRTQNYQSCPKQNPHVSTLLPVLLDLDYHLRFVKYAWDASDGEVVAYGDVWIADGTVTQQQFGRYMGNFLSALDVNTPRIVKAIAEGEDLGRGQEPGIPPGLPDDLMAKLKELLARAAGGRGGTKKPDDDSEITSI